MPGSLQLLGEQRNIPAVMCPRILNFAAAMLCFCPITSLAEEASDYKWGFLVGAFITDQDMKTEFEFNLGDVDIRVDFEDDLGLRDSQSVGRFATFYKFNERHRLDFDVFDLSQTSKAMLEREIVWGDTVFPISTEVATNLDLSIYKIAYTYHPLRRDKGKLGITGGFYVADVGLAVRVLEDDLREAGEVTAPLPVLGLRGEYYLSDRWRLSASIEWFGLEIDAFDGELQDALVGVDYRMSEHSAIGLGYNHVEIDIDATEEDLQADLIWQYSGVIAYLRFTF